MNEPLLLIHIEVSIHYSNIYHLKFIDYLNKNSLIIIESIQFNHIIYDFYKVLLKVGKNLRNNQKLLIHYFLIKTSTINI